MKKRLFKATYMLLASAMMFTASCKKPSASFTANTTTAAVGEPIIFTNTSTDDAKVSWDFGDGTQSDDLSKTVTHVYQQPGVYSVNLLVSKENGKKPSDANALTIVISGPVASFTVSTATPVATQIVSFTSTSTGASSFSWDFGDGSTTAPPTTANTTHAYTKGGSYVVTLTVKDASQTVVSTKTMTIVVGGLGSGNANNQAAIIGTWKLQSRVTTDMRNGAAYTSSNANGNNGIGLSQASSTTYASLASSFTSAGSIYLTDANGNLSTWGSFTVEDSINILFTQTGYSLPNADNSNAPNSGGISNAYSQYTVTPTSLIITYTSTDLSLPAYTDYATPATHAAGEKQVVTTTYTYSK